MAVLVIRICKLFIECCECRLWALFPSIWGYGELCWSSNLAATIPSLWYYPYTETYILLSHRYHAKEISNQMPNYFKRIYYAGLSTRLGYMGPSRALLIKSCYCRHRYHGFTCGNCSLPTCPCQIISSPNVWWLALFTNRDLPFGIRHLRDIQIEEKPVLRTVISSVSSFQPLQNLIISAFESFVCPKK